MTQQKKWATETKSAARRIGIGVATAVVTSATIYFLGFNRSKPKASTVEVKKNTIRVWKQYVQAENMLQPRHDSVFARTVRGELTMEESRSQDSLTGENFIQEINTLLETPDIDKDLSILLTDRIEYKKQEMDFARYYMNRFIVFRDSLMSNDYRNYLIKELNDLNNGRRSSATERLGRNIEEQAAALEKKYKYPFRIKDFHFNDIYQSIKAARQAEIGPKSDLPDLN